MDKLLVTRPETLIGAAALAALGPRLDIVGGDGDAFGELGDAGITGRGDDLGDARALLQAPGKSVFAASGPDYENFHGNYPAGLIAGVISCAGLVLAGRVRQGSRRDRTFGIFAR